MEALDKANAVRKERAELKRNIRAGRVDVAALIENPPDWLETMKVFELLKALPKVGRIKANTLMRKFKISPSKTVGGLSDRQRLELANGVRTRQPGSMRIGSAAA